MLINSTPAFTPSSASRQSPRREVAGWAAPGTEGRPDTFTGWVDYNLTYAPGETAFKAVVSGAFGSVFAGAAGLAVSALLPSSLRLAATVASAAAGGLGAAISVLGERDEYGGGGGG